MNFVVFYFSGTGNTEWVVEKLITNLIQKGYECRGYSLEDEILYLEDIIDKADVIGFAFPIYGANMPNLMIKFYQRLKDITKELHDKPAFIVTTAGYIDAYGPFLAGKTLKKIGFKLVSYVNLILSNNVSTPKHRATIQSEENLKKRMKQSEAKIEKLVNKLITRKKYIRNIGFYLLPGILIRKATKKGMINCHLSFSIDKERCKKCMLCINKCPTKSIIILNDEFSFLPTCTACMRCYNFCPVNAVYFEGKYACPRLYKRYKGPKNIV